MSELPNDPGVSGIDSHKPTCHLPIHVPGSPNLTHCHSDRKRIQESETIIVLTQGNNIRGTHVSTTVQGFQGGSAGVDSEVITARNIGEKPPSDLCDHREAFSLVKWEKMAFSKTRSPPSAVISFGRREMVTLCNPVALAPC